ncbi:cytochrome P450 [Nemania abortiva]|nr:cytochrome P450 [Nemania abortiva]
MNSKNFVMHDNFEHGHYEVLSTFFALLLVVAFISRLRVPHQSKQPAWLRDPLPFVYNTLQFVLNNKRFMDRATEALKASNLVKFHLGTRLVYLVRGSQNVQAIWGRSTDIDHNEVMLNIYLPLWHKFSKEDLERFASDKSGSEKVPLPSTANAPPVPRYWYGYEHVHREYLGKAPYLNAMIKQYQDRLSYTLDTLTSQEWTTISIRSFCRQHVSKCNMYALLGPRALELMPGLPDHLWNFDEHVLLVALRTPRWIFSHAYKAHDRYLADFQRYLDATWESFDWADSAATESSWEPCFGSRASREVVKWFKDNNFDSPGTCAGALATLFWGQNCNVVPVLTWALMEVVRDHSLTKDLRKEILTAYDTDPDTKSRRLSISKLKSLPLLSSVYTELLRLKVSFNLMRDVRKPFVLDGHTVPPGAMLQVPTLVAHYDEDTWGVQGHTASEFWGYRHIKYTGEEKVDASATNTKSKGKFSLSGRGGTHICPGRFYAKQQIMLTIASFVSKFDMEFVRWTNFDGSDSDRAPKNETAACGTGGMPPDRDMEIRIKRRPKDQENAKPNSPPKKDEPISKDGGKKQDDDKKQGNGSLDWLREADHYNPPKQAPKNTGDWMKDDGKLV